MTTPPKSLPLGLWGGEQVRLQIDNAAGVLTLGCARAEWRGTVTPDSQGRFTTSGRYTAFAGGPSTDAEQAVPARFEGQVSGDHLTLTVRHADKTERHTLTRGLQSKVIGCY